MNHTHDNKSTTRSVWGSLALTLLVMLCVSGCADMGEGASFQSGRPVAYSDSVIAQAEDSLTRHDIEGAQAYYNEAVLSSNPFVAGTAHAGKGVTDLLLLPGEETVRALLTSQLGANNRDYDVQRLLWSNNGILFWFNQGVRWEDDGDFQGVRSIVSDELPWSLSRIESVSSFVKGLSEPGDNLMDSMVRVADSARSIERDLSSAIEDPKFEFLYLPADVFHADSLAMALGKSELSMIHSMVSFARGAVYFAAAYENSWTLEGLLSSADEERGDGQFYGGLDPELARSVTRSERLREARLAILSGFLYAENTITLGIAQEEVLSIALLRWDRVDRDLARDLRDIIRAVANAVDGPSKIPHFSEDFTLDLSHFFGEGRTLASEIDWFEMERVSTAGEGAPAEFHDTWVTRDAAIQAYFLDDVFDPPMTVGEDYPAQLELSGDAIEDFMDDLLGDALGRLDTAYSGTGLVD